MIDKCFWTIGLLVLSIPLFSQSSQLLDVCSNRDSSSHTIVEVEDIFFERWDTLAHP